MSYVIDAKIYMLDVEAQLFIAALEEEAKEST